MGAVMNRSPSIRTGRTPVQRDLAPRPARIERGETDPSFVISHRLALEEGPQASRSVRDKQDACVNGVPRP
jgi:threonine dehydrogenase-like Zn-dependent dehydrogenase